MAKRFKKPGPLGPHFIKQWRKYRGLSQDDLADRLGISKATLSRIENRIIPYGQGFLEACADMLRCETADLLMRNPLNADAIWSIWEQIPPTERNRAIEILKAFRRTGTNDA